MSPKAVSAKPRFAASDTPIWTHTSAPIPMVHRRPLLNTTLPTIEIVCSQPASDRVTEVIRVNGSGRQAVTEAQTRNAARNERHPGTSYIKAREQRGRCLARASLQ